MTPSLRALSRVGNLLWRGNARWVVVALLGALIGVSVNSFVAGRVNPTGEVRGGPRLVLDRQIADLGMLRPGEEVTTEFAITNIGRDPLILSDFSTTCGGCTVANISSTNIRPRKQAVLTVRLHA